ncbi:MAG: Phosphoribosylformimino-5-aminoimidazole carboxamide ribotide isomerase [Candidatus Jettenia ecosi]|uniref:1-(5-phosphoribosyl)-5-[(5-phosphoribosylamino)methylideneamino] imidazole-4-carboxamide isomerase n=1 Tax=Candidatus Jettenia ecosi TaxID=2494326 RepID=A0A533QBP5_9BACT|nr:MAG: Phosphoribosylformimino-5-aminoimidazole carboxamide ribotide isomerase [Candidatus Jettenia ecosi]
MLIIPAIDLKGGKCVRLTQGQKDAETIFSDNPVDVARSWQDQGADYLHVVDLDGAFEGAPKNLSIVEQIIKQVKIPIEFGGGLRTTQTIKTVLDLGIDRVIIGTKAIDSPSWVNELCTTFPGRIAVGIDAKNGRVAVKGWTSVCEWTAMSFAREIEKASPCAIIYTDISKDGMLQGPNISSLQELLMTVKIPIIASGGISSLKDIEALSKLPIAGMIIGKALYTGHIKLPEAKQVCNSHT